MSARCSCVKFCGDVDERADDPLAVCKHLPDPPRQPLIEFYVVHRDDLQAERTQE